MCKFFALGLVALSLVGCASLDAQITKFNTAVNKYAPIIGRDILMIGNIIVTAECSPAVVPATAQAISILNIVAPTSNAAQTVTAILQTNADVTQRICPLVASIKATVGAVNQMQMPSQVIPATPVAAAL
ncbi:MAG: hypothetical protein JWM36_3264 [Hyphomicrobiales bacterium]|nr:hypothetical protein [Hyphomicrobiales bacterium]